MLINVSFQSKVNYGLDGQVVDPDSGKNYLKKRITLSTPKTTSDEEIPTSEFQTDLSILPRVRYANIWKFLTNDIEVKKPISAEKPLVKGYNFFSQVLLKKFYHKKEIVYIL